MALGKSSEMIKGLPAEESVFQHGNVFGVKGQTFQQQFMANFVLPTRREMAMLVIQAIYSSGKVHGSNPEEIAKHAFAQADAFIKAEFDTIDIEGYFKLYMEGPASKDMGEILRAAVDRAQDYSL